MNIVQYGFVTHLYITDVYVYVYTYNIARNKTESACVHAVLTLDWKGGFSSMNLNLLIYESMNPVTCRFSSLLFFSPFHSHHFVCTLLY